MRVLNIIQCANLGGMEQASLRLMLAMRGLGVESELLSLHPVGGLEKLLEPQGIAYDGMNYRGPAGVGIIGELANRLKASKADRFVMTGPHLAAMLAMKLAGKRGGYLAVHFHHTGVKSPRVWRWIYKLALDRFDWVVFPSDFVRNEAVAILPALEKRSLTIRYPQVPGPLPMAEERRASRAKLSLPEDAFVMGNAGWLIQRKRFDVFLDVAAKVAAQMPNARFLIAGGGELEPQLREQAERLGIASQVVWLGWQNDLTDFYRSLDVMLFNAEWDTLPVTPQEAVANGVPLVASLLHGGLREIFDADLSARILDQHDIDALAGQVLAIANDPEAARAKVLLSREQYLRVSEPSGIAAAHLDLLNRKP